MILLQAVNDPLPIGGLFIIVVIAFFYFIPAMVAYRHKKKNAQAIFTLNLFLGWTFVGWVVAMVWAQTKD